MNREEFIKAIKKLHVPPYLYNLEGSGRNDERFCLVKKDTYNPAVEIIPDTVILCLIAECHSILFERFREDIECSARFYHFKSECRKFLI